MQLIDYPKEQIHGSGSNEAVQRFFALIQERCYNDKEYDRDDLPHHIPCYGCGRPVHGQYCFNFLIGVVICDSCGTAADKKRMLGPTKD